MGRNFGACPVEGVTSMLPSIKVLCMHLGTCAHNKVHMTLIDQKDLQLYSAIDSIISSVASRHHRRAAGVHDYTQRELDHRQGQRVRPLDYDWH